ncbi:MAG: glycine cleavage system H protein [Chlamydiales bacterium]|jgi:glycine cleavage system H protein
MSETQPYLRYKRSKFSTRLPHDRRYTAAHMWVWGQGEDLWRIGFTKFALRMLGDPVEFEFEAAAGDAVETGQVVGWIEGFKAVTDVFSPMDGAFVATNPELDEDLDLLHSSPYESGWLFSLRGTPDPACMDAAGYSGLLDATIDRMQGQDA